MLNRQIRNAAPRIELVRRRKSICWTRGLAGGATATLITVRDVFFKLKIKRGEDASEEQPTAMLCTDKIGVLALPS